MKKFFLELNQKLKRLIVVKNYFTKKHYAKIEVNTDDNVPLNKKLKFPTLTITIRCVFQNGKKLYPQNLYLQKLYPDLFR